MDLRSLILLLSMLGLSSCTSLQAGKAKTDAGVDRTEVTTPDGTKVVHEVQHDKRDSDQGNAKGLLKTADIKAEGGAAGMLGDFDASIASAANSWIKVCIGVVFILAAAVLYKFNPLAWKTALTLAFVGAIIIVFPIWVIAVALILGIAFVAWEAHRGTLISGQSIAGTKKLLDSMKPHDAEQAKEIIKTEQDKSVQADVKKIAATKSVTPSPIVLGDKK